MHPELSPRSLAEGLYFEDPSRTTRYLLINAFANVGLVYIASVSSLNRWKALLKYDAVVPLEESPRLKVDQDTLARTRRRWTIVQFLTMFIVIGTCIAAVLAISYLTTEPKTSLLLQTILGLVIFSISYTGYEHLISLLTEELCLRVIRRTRAGESISYPSYTVASRSRNSSIVHRVFFAATALYTAVAPNPYLASVAVLGITLMLMRRPFIPRRATAFSMRALLLISLAINLVFVPLILVQVISSFRQTRDTGVSFKASFGQFRFVEQVAAQMGLALTGILVSASLRYEWSIAPVELRSGRSDAEFGIEDCDASDLDQTLEPATPSAPRSQVSETKFKVIRLPPTLYAFPERSSAPALNSYSFPAPIFQAALFSMLVIHIPAIIFSLPAFEYLRTSPDISSTTSFVVAFIIRFPSEFWGLILTPIVIGEAFIVKVWMGEDWKTARGLWDYSEEWVKRMPRQDAPIAIRVENVVEVHRDHSVEEVSGNEENDLHELVDDEDDIENLPLIHSIRR